MILREPAAGLMARPAPRTALILGILYLLLLPAWSSGHRLESARSRPGAQVGRAASLGSRQTGMTGEVNAPRPAVPYGQVAGSGVAALAVEQKVVVSQPIVREVSDYVDFVGHVEAARTIKLRARVGGRLDKVYPQAEQVIEKGGLLFEIDPRPYQVGLEKAEAEVKRSEAELKRRSAEWQRAKALKATGGIQQDEFDRIEGEHDKAEASLEVARATRDLDRLKLDSTKVTAPIRGKVSLAQIAAGNRVVANSTVLATITSPDPTHVGFDVDERTFLRLGRESREGKAMSALEPGLPVLVGLADEEGFSRRGQVDSVGGRFDPNTGTVRCRAVVPNPDGLLLPGLFARVRLVTSAPSQALLVSEGALLSDQGRNALFVVNDRGVVERRTVRLGARHDDLRVVIEGLKEGEWVVVDGVQAVNANMTVKPERVSMPTRSKTPRNERGH